MLPRRSYEAIILNAAATLVGRDINPTPTEIEKLIGICRAAVGKYRQRLFDGGRWPAQTTDWVPPCKNCGTKQGAIANGAIRPARRSAVIYGGPDGVCLKCFYRFKNADKAAKRTERSTARAKSINAWEDLRSSLQQKVAVTEAAKPVEIKPPTPIVFHQRQRPTTYASARADLLSLGAVLREELRRSNG